VSSNGYSPLPAARFEGSLFEALAPTRARRPQRYWLHALLLLLTLITTTVVGAGLSRSFAEGRPFDFDIDLQGYAAMWKDPGFLLQGLPFSLTLLTILMAHEMGHYLTARYYGVDASLPFFIPAPTLIGTLGAFIRIRSAILSKRVLFDIGIGGPLAGFAVLVGPLVAGVSLSKVAPGIAAHGELIFGTPLILRVFEWVQFPHVASASGGARGVGGSAGDGSESVADRATGWRSYSVRVCGRADAQTVARVRRGTGSAGFLSTLHH
jgi:hypothetical protein